MKKISNILIVCLGNTARSPVAEYLAREYAKKKGVHLIFESAGFINAFSDMQPQSRDYLKSKGIDYSNFHPKIINKNLLENQDLIITMEKSHADEIRSNFQEIFNTNKQIFTLKEFNGESEDLDIIDPYYANSNIYKRVLKIIDSNVEKMIDKIIQINQS